MNVRNSLCLALIVAGVLTPAFDVAAAPTPILSYQARITGNSGSTIADGTYAMRFKIYSVATDGTALWEESHTANVSDGVVSVRLGTSETIGLDFNSGDYYLGVTIGNDSELSPRIQLGAVPFAANTAKLDGKSVGTGANNVLGLDSSGGFSVGGTIQTSGNLDAGTSTLDRLTVSTDSAFQAGLVVANDLQAGTTTLDRLTVTDGLTVQSGSVSLPTGSVAAGALNVAALNNQGKIRALTGDYVESLDGSALTNIGAAAIQNNSIDFSKLSNALTLDANTTVAMANRNLFYNLTGTGEFTVALDGVDATFAIEQDNNPFLEVTDGDITVQLPASGDSFIINQTVGSPSNAFIVATTPSANGTNSSGIVVSQQNSASPSGLYSGLTVTNRDTDLAINSALTINDAGGGYNWYMIAPNFEITGAGGLKVGCSGGGTCSTFDRYFDTTSTVDFASTASGSCTASGDVTLTGVVAGDRVSVATGTNVLSAGTFLTGHVTAANTVRIQFCNLSGIAVDPANDSYRVSAMR